MGTKLISELTEAAAVDCEDWIEIETAASESRKLAISPIADVAVTSPAASNAITATVYLNVLANATIADAGLTCSVFTVDDTNKRITYTGTPTRVFVVQIGVSMTSSKSNDIVRLRIAKNGTTDPNTEIQRKLGTGADSGAASVQGTFSLATNDYIEIFGTLDVSSSDTITITNLNASIR